MKHHPIIRMVKNVLKFFFYKYMLLKNLLFVDTTTESPENISANSLVDDLNKIKEEPEDFHDSNLNPSKGNEVTSKNDLIDFFDKSHENRTGKF